MEISILAKSIPAKADRLRMQWLPLWLHLKDTGGILLWLYHHWLPENEKQALFQGIDPSRTNGILTLLGMLHDLGKATPAFAAHIVRAMPELALGMETAGLPFSRDTAYQITHAAAGEVLLTHRYGWNEAIASIIGAHHGKPQHGDFNAEIEWKKRAYLMIGRADEGDAWQQAQNELVSYAEACARCHGTELPVPAVSSQALLSGLLIMADWIASNVKYFPLLPLTESGNHVNTERRLENALTRLRLPPCWKTEATPEWGSMLYDLRFGQGEMPFIPRTMQIAAAEIAAGVKKPGLLILEAPMGSGKTEAALVAAELFASRAGCGGIFFGLPTQATANAIFRRVKLWANKQSEETIQTINLCHRMARLHPELRDLLSGTPADVYAEESGLELHSFFQGKKTALLSSFTVGTVDQLLMAALRRKHVVLRHLGLAGKVIIVDEAHAYDTYMEQYLQRVLSWLGAWGTPVILLSATLPAGTRTQLMDAYMGVSGKKRDSGASWRESQEYPLITWSDGEEVFQRTVAPEGPVRTIQLQTMDDDARITLLQEYLSDGGCAGVICNTVARAQAFAHCVEETIPDARLLLLHAQFTFPDRAHREETLLQWLGRDGMRPQKLVLVGTQVIEQSLDIDLDLLITDLCPMDLLLQRIGRLHRHDRQRSEKLKSPLCFVTGVTDEEVSGQKIYAEYLLLQTRALLPTVLRLPDDISPLVQEVYHSAPIPAGASVRLRQAREAFEIQLREKELRARDYRLKAPTVGSRFFMPTLHGLLDARLEGDERSAEAGVRDGGASVEVLLLCRAGESNAAILSEGTELMPLDRVPSMEEAIAIARQRIRLPFVLCAPWSVDSTIRELEAQTASAAPEWKNSPWLRGELLLLLAADGRTSLNGYALHYDKVYGLVCEKETDGRRDQDHGPLF